MYSIVNKLFNTKINFNDFFNAVENNNIDVVKEYLNNYRENINNVDIYGNTALIIASRCNNNEIVDLLIDNGADVNKTNHHYDTALTWAVYNGNFLITSTLINAGANTNVAYENGDTPLITAIKRGFVDIVKLLLNTNCNVNQSNKDKQTPLAIAANFNKKEIVKLLIDKGAELNNVDENNNDTVLNWAVFLGYTDIVELLLNADANPDIPDKFGRTPLMYAVMKKQLHMVRLLVEAGCDIGCKDKKGGTAKSFSKTNEITQILEQAENNIFVFYNKIERKIKKILKDSSYNSIQKQKTLESFINIVTKSIKFIQNNLIEISDTKKFSSLLNENSNFLALLASCDIDENVHIYDKSSQCLRKLAAIAGDDTAARIVASFANNEINEVKSNIIFSREYESYPIDSETAESSCINKNSL
jgi:ankyrin repeat protein